MSRTRREEFRRSALAVSLLLAPLASIFAGCAADGGGNSEPMPGIILTESMPIFSVPTISYGDTLLMRVGFDPPSPSNDNFTVQVTLTDGATGSSVPPGDILSTYSAGSMPDVTIGLGAEVTMYDGFQVKEEGDIDAAYEGDLIKAYFTIKNSAGAGTSGTFYVYFPR